MKLNFLENMTNVNIVRIVIVIICMNIKNIPNSILEYVNLFIIRLIIGLVIVYVAFYDPIIAILIAICFMLIVKQNKLNSKYDENNSEPLEVIRIIDNSLPISLKDKLEYFNDVEKPDTTTTTTSENSQLQENIKNVESIVSKYICNPQEECKVKENSCFRTLTENLE